MPKEICPFKGKKEKELKVKDSKCQRRFARRPIPDRYGEEKFVRGVKRTPSVEFQISCLNNKNQKPRQDFSPVLKMVVNIGNTPPQPKVL